MATPFFSILPGDFYIFIRLIEFLHLLRIVFSEKGLLFREKKGEEGKESKALRKPNTGRPYGCRNAYAAHPYAFQDQSRQHNPA